MKIHMSNTKVKSDLQLKIEREGYIWNEKYGMSEHRAVAYQILGRFLETDEHVHHCNHVKVDNDPKNLFVLSPAVHDIVHICTIIRPREWPSGIILMDPDKLSQFLKSEGIPHIWLWEAQNDKVSRSGV